MYVITVEDKAKSTKDGWKRQYFVSGVWKVSDKKREVYEELVSLGDNPTSEEVNKVIGNNSWTYLECDECGKEVNEVVVFETYHEYQTEVCKKCLSKSVKLIKVFGNDLGDL